MFLCSGVSADSQSLRERRTRFETITDEGSRITDVTENPEPVYNPQVQPPAPQALGHSSSRSQEGSQLSLLDLLQPPSDSATDGSGGQRGPEDVKGRGTRMR